MPSVGRGHIWVRSPSRQPASRPRKPDVADTPVVRVTLRADPAAAATTTAYEPAPINRSPATSVPSTMSASTSPDSGSNATSSTFPISSPSLDSTRLPRSR